MTANDTFSSFENFAALDIRIGTIVRAESFPEGDAGVPNGTPVA
ncbi:hypothetical protein [Paenibacillus arenilitoris]|nr:hypothetical protein [Paenibacillus arenilitoris]